MLSLLAAATASQPILWENLGLQPGIDLGFFTLRFYSLAYILGAAFAYWHTWRALKEPGAPMAQRHAEDLFFYCLLGIIFGGRLGYAIFYQPELLTSVNLFKLWTGGMSFHGGLVGVLAGITWVTWRNNLSWIRVCDYISVSVPVGMMLGRLANFNNGELYGRPADVPWAMIFPDDPTGLARHPSQLYQAGLEGLTLAVIMLLLFWTTRARYRPGLLVGIFTLGIGLARFTVEFFREPDSQLKEFAVRTGLSMGQWLSVPLILVGLGVIAYAMTRNPVGTAAEVKAGSAPAA